MENIIYTLENRQLINMQKKLIRKAGNDDGIENSSEKYFQKHHFRGMAAIQTGKFQTALCLFNFEPNFIVFLCFFFVKILKPASRC